EGLRGRASDRDDPLLVSLADASDNALVEIDAGPIEPDRLADAQAGAVEELDESGVPKRTRGRPASSLDEPLRLARRQRARELAATAWGLDLGRGVACARAE